MLGREEKSRIVLVKSTVEFKVRRTDIFDKKTSYSLFSIAV